MASSSITGYQPFTHPLGNSTEPRLKLQFTDGQRRWIDLSQFVRLEASNNYTHCIFQDGSRLLVSISLCHLLERVPTKDFIRIHNKHAVNRQYVCGVLRARKIVQLITGEDVSIARRRMREVVLELSRVG